MFVVVILDVIRLLIVALVIWELFVFLRDPIVALEAVNGPVITKDDAVQDPTIRFDVVKLVILAVAIFDTFVVKVLRF
jgi:hypothetical protein